MIDKNLPPDQYASSITPRPMPVMTLFPGAQTPRESAFLSQKSLDMKQTSLVNISKGGKRSHGKQSHGKQSHGKQSHGKQSHGKQRTKYYKNRGGATGDTVVIPSLTVDYPNAGDIHQTHQKVVQSLMQNQANAQMDSNVKLKGGKCIKLFGNKKTNKRGGTVWGCYSGGIKKTRRKSKKSKKSRKK
jgi:hypothetical protein